MTIYLPQSFPAGIKDATREAGAELVEVGEPGKGADGQESPSRPGQLSLKEQGMELTGHWQTY